MISQEQKDQHSAYAQSVGTTFALAVTKKRELGYRAKAKKIQDAQEAALAALEGSVPDSVIEIIDAATEAAYNRELDNAAQAEEIFRFLLTTIFPPSALGQVDLDALGGEPVSLAEIQRIRERSCAAGLRKVRKVPAEA